MRDNEFLKAALERLKNDAPSVKGQKEKAMASAVRKAMEDFCRQEPEFAQAIVQGGSFGDCMATVAKGVGASISDAEAYAKAARFYFPGSRVRVVMEIDLVGDAGEEASSIDARSPSSASGGVYEGPQLIRPEQKTVAVKLLDLNDLFNDTF